MLRRPWSWALPAGAALLLGVLAWQQARQEGDRLLLAGLPRVAELKGRDGSEAAVLRQIEEAERELTAHPATTELLGRLGMIYHANLLYTQAERCYALARQRDAADLRWPYFRALLRERLGERQQALEQLQQAQRLRPGWYPARIRSADNLFKLERFGEAESIYRALAQTDAGQPRPMAILGLARIAGLQGRWEEVIGLVRPLLERHPDFRPARQLLLRGHEVLGQHEEADRQRELLARSKVQVFQLDELTTELEDLASSSTALLRSAELARRRGDRRRQQALLRRAAALAPQDGDTHLALAAALLDELAGPGSAGPGGRPPARGPAGGPGLGEAVDHLRQALRLAPGAPDVHARLGLALFYRGAHAEAEQQYREALKLRPDEPETLHALGISLAAQGRDAEALGLFRRALLLEPTLAEARYHEGLALAGLGRDVEAMQSYRLALVQQPGLNEARVNLGVLFARQGELDQAEALFREALRRQPGLDSAASNLALVEQLRTAAPSSPPAP